MSQTAPQNTSENVDHGLVAENFINDLCQIRFFKDFVVRNPKYSNSGGEKEVSDVLVIFNDIMLNIQVKSKIEEKPFSKKNETDIQRIEKKIDKGIEQLKELTSVINNKKVNSFKTERGITIPLIGQNFRKIGIVCLNLSGEEQLPIDEQTNLKMYYTDKYDHEIHCFKNEVFKCILDELTTLPDFLRYLEYRKIFLKNEAIVPLTKELDFLAFYKSRYPEVKRGASEIKERKKFFLVLEENLWKNYLSHTEELNQRSEDDEVSRWFDYLIETKSESIGFKATKNAVPGSEESYWQIICQLAKLDRLQRRAFSEQCLKKAILADNSPRGYNYFLMPFPELKIAFVYVAYRSTNREERRELLQVLCESAAVTMKKSTLIITQILGIATENFSSEFHSDDMLLADAEGLIESLPADSPLFDEKNNFFAPMSQTKVFEFRQNK